MIKKFSAEKVKKWCRGNECMRDIKFYFDTLIEVLLLPNQGRELLQLLAVQLRAVSYRTPLLQWGLMLSPREVCSRDLHNFQDGALVPRGPVCWRACWLEIFLRWILRKCRWSFGLSFSVLCCSRLSIHLARQFFLAESRLQYSVYQSDSGGFRFLFGHASTLPDQLADEPPSNHLCPHVVWWDPVNLHLYIREQMESWQWLNNAVP